MERGRLKKYQDRIKQYNQNRTFQNNERKFYQKIGGECKRIYKQPDVKEAKQFWSKIWEWKEHNRMAKWINNMEKKVTRLWRRPSGNNTSGIAQSNNKKIPNWKHQAKSGKNQNAQRKGNLHVLGNIGSGHYQTSRNERKNKKRLSQSNEKTSQNQTLQQESHQKDKQLGSPHCKILRTILEMDKRRTSTNGPEDKKANNDV